jgi:hypothetical protein
MATNNKFIVERTNVLSADVTVGTSYAALDSGDFGFYGKAGETYEFEARVAYSAAAATDGGSEAAAAAAGPAVRCMQV